MSTLERAISIAARAHEGQRDKAGAPYILHPLRVMMRMAEDDERIVAVLHDVIEDTSVTLSVLRAEGFSEQVLEALEHLTRRPDEDYEQFIVRAAKTALSRRVKLADLEDNSDLGRFANASEADRLRAEKYRRALDQLRTAS